MRSLVLLVAPIVCLAARAEDPPRDKDASSPLREQYQLAAKKYAFFLDKEKKVPLTFEPKAIFSWASDNDWSGDLFVWTLKGRPQVVGCILSSPTKPDRTAIHEFHTLADGPLAPTEMAAKYRWAPETGAEFKKLDGAPAAKPAERLVQMRALARDFRASMQAEGKSELRLLTQPIHRYQPTDDAVIDGALFAWVWARGTDPEVVVAVECHRTDKGLEWRYAPLRFTTREVWLELGDKEVWRVPFHREKGEVTSAYTTRPVGKIVLPPPKAP